MKRFAVIVAGGSGTRMQSDLPKQFMLLLDAPVLMHTVEKFALADEHASLVLVLPEDQIDVWNRLCAQVDFDIPHQIVKGGATRYDSVKQGLSVCGDSGVVAIHDGVRPLVSPSLIQQCYEQAERTGSALPVVPVTQSLRKVDGDRNAALSREGIVAVQTPQCFDLTKLKPCYDKAYDPAFTDDATVFELAGHPVHLVDGEATNLKITTQADLRIAEAIMSSAQH